MKKLLSLLMVGLISTGLLFGCSPSTPESTTQQSEKTGEANKSNEATNANKTDGEVTKLTVWAWDPKFNIDIMNNAGTRYNANHPNVEVEVIEMSKADVEQKLHTNLASKMTQGLPDIVLIEDYNAQKYLQSYPGAFADLTEEMNYSDFSPYKVKLMTLNDKFYGVPFDSGASAIFYRSDIFAEAGFKAEDLEDITWDRLIEIGKEVKAKTGKALLPFGKEDGGLVRIMLQSAGTWYFDIEGNIRMAYNDALNETIDVFKKIIDADIIKPTSGWNEWVGGFNSGDAAAVVTGAWIIGSIKSATDQSGKWAVAPTPKLTTVDSVNASNLGGSSWYILDSSKNKAEATNFMKEIFAGDIEFYQDILVKNGAIASYTPAHSGEAYTADDEFFGGQKIYKELSDYMLEIPGINYGLYTYEADAATMGQMADILSGKKTIFDALIDAENNLVNQIQ